MSRRRRQPSCCCRQRRRRPRLLRCLATCQHTLQRALVRVLTASPRSVLAAVTSATLSARAQRCSGGTPLYLAAMTGNTGAVRLLLRRLLVCSSAFPWDRGKPARPCPTSPRARSGRSYGVLFAGYLTAHPPQDAYQETASLLLEAMPPTIALPVLNTAVQLHQQPDQR